MTEIECAYLAGIIDGEGCIGVYFDSGYYLLRLIITSTSVDWLKNLKSSWGDVGNLFIDNKKKKTNHKIKANWVLRGSTAQKILSQVIPYLKIKRTQAEVALQFKSAKNVRDEKTGRFIGTSAEELIRHGEIATTLKALKRESYQGSVN